MKLSCRGVTYLLSITAAAALGSFTFIPIAWLCFPFSYMWFRSIADGVGSLWFHFVTLALEKLYGVAFHVTDLRGDSKRLQPLPPRCLVISNHRTRLDWMFLWSLFARPFEALKSLKIILKADLKPSMFFGWCMQALNFLFLQRNMAKDAAYLARQLRFLSDKAHFPAMTLLIFPEGTDLSPRSVFHSNAFADKGSVPRYQQVLHPRTTGLKAIARHFHGSLQGFLDLTIAYEGRIPQNEAALASGAMPSAIHIVVEEAPLAALASEEAVERYVIDSFRRKEQRLRFFYSFGRWPREGDALTAAAAAPAPIVAADSPPPPLPLEDISFTAANAVSGEATVLRPRLAQYGAAAAFLVTAAAWLWLCWAFPLPALAYGAAVVAGYEVITRVSSSPPRTAVPLYHCRITSFPPPPSTCLLVFPVFFFPSVAFAGVWGRRSHCGKVAVEVLRQLAPEIQRKNAALLHPLWLTTPIILVFFCFVVRFCVSLCCGAS